MDESNVITVRHSVLDGKHHVDIYLPGEKYTWREASWPVTPEADSIGALWSGIDEAMRWCSVFGYEAIATMSTDREALAEFNRQCNETTKGSAEDGVQSDDDRTATDAQKTGNAD